MRVKYISAFVLAALLMAPLHAVAADDCTVDFKGVNTFLNQHAFEVRRWTPVKRNSETQTLVQTMELSNGVNVALLMGGCASYYYDLTLSNLPNIRANSSKETIIAALKQAMIDFPLRKNAEFARVQSALFNPANWQSNGSFACDGTLCSVQAEEGRVTIHYEQAL